MTKLLTNALSPSNKITETNQNEKDKDYDHKKKLFQTASSPKTYMVKRKFLHTHCLNPISIYTQVEAMDKKFGLSTSCKSVAQIHKVMSHGLYLQLKDILSRSQKMSKHRITTSKDNQLSSFPHYVKNTKLFEYREKKLEPQKDIETSLLSQKLYAERKTDDKKIIRNILDQG